MPRDERSNNTSASSNGRKARRSSNGSKERDEKRNSKEKDLVPIDDTPKSPAITDRPGTIEQPLAIPGAEEDPKDTDKQSKKDSREKEHGKSKHSKSSSHKDLHGVDLAKIIRQQTELLQALKAIPSAAGSLSSSSHTSTAPAVQQSVQQANRPRGRVANQEQVVHDDVIMEQVIENSALEGGENAENQDPGLVSTLNLAFKVDPNAGDDIDPDIAQFVENCLKLPAALEWEDMKIIRDVYKRPKNCPSIGVPKIPDSLERTMSQAGKDRDKYLSFAQSWVMTAISAMGRIVSELKPFEMDDTVPWVRPIYAKSLDVVRILSHLSVNELSKRRKAEVKNFLPAQYKKLANPKPAEPEIHLFGEEISEDIKACDEEAKVTNKLKSSDFIRGRYHPYRSQRGRSRNTGPAVLNRNYQANWNNQYQAAGQYQVPNNNAYQGFQAASPPPQPPPYQFPNRPFRGRGRGQRRRGARQ